MQNRREFKFRVWSAIDSCFYPNIDLNRKNISVLYEITDELILLQYTGLKDNNGVEIYEGDIILRLNKQIYFVAYGHCSFKLYSLDYIGFPKDDMPKGGWDVHKINANTHYPQHRTNLIDYEVVGNIYENPELLGDLDNAS